MKPAEFDQLIEYLHTEFVEPRREHALTFARESHGETHWTSIKSAAISVRQLGPRGAASKRDLQNLDGRLLESIEAQLRAVLMIVNMLSALVVHAFYAVLRPKLATSRLEETPQRREDPPA